MTKTFLRLIVVTISATLAPQLFAQAQTDVPTVVPNATQLSTRYTATRSAPNNGPKRSMFHYLFVATPCEASTPTDSYLCDSAVVVSRNNSPD